MKALMLVMASLLFSSQLKAESTNKQELTDSFIDSIKSVSDENHTLVVTFKRHATLYRVTKDHPKFSELKAMLEKAQKVDQKVKVVAIIPSMTIKEIKE